MTNQNSIYEEIKCRFTAENSCYYSVQPFKNVGSLLTNEKSIYEEIKCRLKAGNSYS